MESTDQFESRKQDHIRYALDAKNEASGLSGLDHVGLWHEPLPELDFSEINISQKTFGHQLSTPFLVSSMTAGHRAAPALNQMLAEACGARGWMMGVGSQRRELFDPEAAQEWTRIRKAAPKTVLLGNIGLSQLIESKPEEIKRLANNLEAAAMIVHLNPLQECLQPEGTPRFRGGLQALEQLCKTLSVPVVVKETGCGFGPKTLTRLRDVGIHAVDVSGFGGTHWGRIEGDRAQQDPVRAVAAQTFQNWGVSTLDSMIAARATQLPFAIWGSGGVRSGLDAAKLLALGAAVVGFAKPVLAAALTGVNTLDQMMQTIEFELRIALFCSGCANISDLQTKDVLQWPTKK